MTDIAAAMAQQPVLLAACVGVVGLLLFMLLTRKSYGPLPSALSALSKPVVQQGPANLQHASAQPICVSWLLSISIWTAD